MLKSITNIQYLSNYYTSLAIQTKFKLGMILLQQHLFN